MFYFFPVMALLQLGSTLIKPCNSLVTPARYHYRKTLTSRLAVSLHNTATATNTSDTSSSSLSSIAAKADRSNLIAPEDICDYIPYPKALSPSAIMEFKKCPQSFLFQYLLGLKQDTSLALAKGSMCHSALEQIFDLDPKDRTLGVLQDLFRAEWAKHRLSDTYRILFEKPQDDNPETVVWDTKAEKQWGQSALRLLQNYYRLEDPRKVNETNPIKREMWLNSHLSIDPELGATGSNFNPRQDETVDVPTFHVRGIVDRLDLVRTTDSPDKVNLRVIDYKTGKAPNLKYSKAMNEKIIEESFFQLKIYALLLREKGAGRELSFKTNELDVRFLRLLYLNSEPGKAVHWDLDMGATTEERTALLQTVHKELSQVWMDIVELVSQQDAKAFVGCDRSFCYCHQCRERFIPETVWQPPAYP